jgi:NitT/TauT family transport system permease protein
MYLNFKYILPDIGITLMEIIIGYIIGATIGISLSVIFTRWPLFDALFTPYILLMVATPMIALVPLLMLWLGFSPLTKIIAVVMGSFPVILINSGLGFKSTDPKRIAIAKSLGANEGQIFRFIRFPSALPSIFTGLIIGGLFAIITAVGAEFAGGGSGLGNRILYYSALVETPMMFGIIILLAIMGVSIYMLISYISQRVTKWH